MKNIILFDLNRFERFLARQRDSLCGRKECAYGAEIKQILNKISHWQKINYFVRFE